MPISRWPPDVCRGRAHDLSCLGLITDNDAERPTLAAVRDRKILELRPVKHPEENWKIRFGEG